MLSERPRERCSGSWPLLSESNYRSGTSPTSTMISIFDDSLFLVSEERCKMRFCETNPIEMLIFSLSCVSLALVLFIQKRYAGLVTASARRPEKIRHLFGMANRAILCLPCSAPTSALPSTKISLERWRGMQHISIKKGCLNSGSPTLTVL